MRLRIESLPGDWVFVDSNHFGRQDVSLSITQDKNSVVLYDKMFDFTKLAWMIVYLAFWRFTHVHVLSLKRQRISVDNDEHFVAIVVGRSQRNHDSVNYNLFTCAQVKSLGLYWYCIKLYSVISLSKTVKDDPTRCSSRIGFGASSPFFIFFFFFFFCWRCLVYTIYGRNNIVTKMF